jgi:hypothetical protein
MANKTIDELTLMNVQEHQPETDLAIIQNSDQDLKTIPVSKVLRSSSSGIEFLDKEKILYQNNAYAISNDSRIFYLSEYGATQSTSFCIVSCYIRGGTYPYVDVTFGGSVRYFNANGVGVHWTQQMMVPVKNAKLEFTITGSRKSDGELTIKLHAYG